MKPVDIEAIRSVLKTLNRGQTADLARAIAAGRFDAPDSGENVVRRLLRVVDRLTLVLLRVEQDRIQDGAGEAIRCPSCKRAALGSTHDEGCGLDEALTLVGLGSQVQRFEARLRLEGRHG